MLKGNKDLVVSPFLCTFASEITNQGLINKKKKSYGN